MFVLRNCRITKQKTGYHSAATESLARTLLNFHTAILGNYSIRIDPDIVGRIALS